MKIENYFTKLTSLAAAALLFVGLSGVLNAQSNQYVIVDATPKSGFYAEAGPTFMTGDSGGDTSDYFGAMIGVGYRYDYRNFGHKFALSFGYLYHSNTEHGEVTILGQSFEARGDRKSTVTPVLATYDFSIPLNKTRTVELRLGGGAGMLWFTDKFDFDNTDVGIEFKESAFAFSGNVGITYHMTHRLYLDFGYRFLISTDLDGDVKAKYNGQSYAIDTSSSDIEAHLFTGSIGFKF